MHERTKTKCSKDKKIKETALKALLQFRQPLFSILDALNLLAFNDSFRGRRYTRKSTTITGFFIQVRAFFSFRIIIIS